MTKVRTLASILLLATAFANGSASAAATANPTTVVLVHGAFAGSSSWNAVVSDLQTKGFTVIAAANPLRSVAGDADYIARIVASVPGPVVLVGHSYGGEVISVAAAGAPNVKGLVFVAAFAPETGESAASLGQQFPTGTLGPALAPAVKQADGGGDMYIDQGKFWQQFAADVPQATARQMAATQRPILASALAESVGAAAWKTIPSWFIYGSRDKNIPAALHAFMAKRAAAKASVVIKGASHVVMISHPHEVARLIERAAGE